MQLKTGYLPNFMRLKWLNSRMPKITPNAGIVAYHTSQNLLHAITIQ